MGSHKKKSRRHSRSRSRSNEDHKSRQKSRKTRRRSSSSSSNDSPQRRGHASKSSRYRSRSRSYSPSRRRSRSRSRDDYARRRRKSRSNSRSRRSHSRRRSRSRSRSCHRERRRRSHSGSRSQHSSRKCSPTERDKLKGKQAKDEKTSSDPAPSDMLKQKMQKALENAAGATAASMETNAIMKEINEDDPEMKKELKRIEKDSFRQTAFKSSRWDLNPPKPSSLTSRPVSINQSHDLAIFGGSATNGSAHPTLQHPNIAAILYRPNWKLTCESLRASPKEKMDRWIEKLQMWRKKRIDEAEHT